MSLKNQWISSVKPLEFWCASISNIVVRCCFEEEPMHQLAHFCDNVQVTCWCISWPRLDQDEQDIAGSSRNSFFVFVLHVFFFCLTWTRQYNDIAVWYLSFCFYADMFVFLCCPSWSTQKNYHKYVCARLWRACLWKCSNSPIIHVFQNSTMPPKNPHLDSLKVLKQTKLLTFSLMEEAVV